MTRNGLFCLILVSTMLVGVGCKKKPTSIRPTLHYAAKTDDIQNIQKLISERKPKGNDETSYRQRS